MATATKSKLHHTRIDIPESNRIQLVELLNRNLANLTDLKTQVKFAHWNVKGNDFYQVHELFDEMAAEVEAHIDLVAERATTLGGIAHGTLRQAAATSDLPEYDLNALNSQQHITALAERYAKAGQKLREAIDAADAQDDKDTADIFTEISRNIDMRLWFLEAHLQA